MFCVHAVKIKLMENVQPVVSVKEVSHQEIAGLSLISLRHFMKSTNRSDQISKYIHLALFQKREWRCPFHIKLSEAYE